MGSTPNNTANDILAVIEKLGNDFNFAVMKAKWNNKTVVVKRYKFAENEALLMEYRANTFQLLCNIGNHENILKIFGISERIDNHFTLLIEFADCGTLHERIHGTGVESYTRDTALNWMYQCAKGLAFLHEQHIGHYNIKPRNLFLTKNFRQLKIGEIGVLFDQIDKHKSLEYKPPEGPPSLEFNEKYDVFSFGMVLWEVLTRQKPSVEMRDDFTPFLEDLPTDKIRSLIESCWRGNPRMEIVATTIALEIGYLKLGEIIGYGSFGAIYKSQLLDMKCAVKVLHVYNEDVRKEIEREVKYLSQVSHPNIIKLFGTVQAGSKTLIWTEFADGGSLYDYIHEKKENYLVCNVVRWMTQLASGLNYLHGMKPEPIIHRDIKTKNLLLTNDHHVLMIADFGTVREKATLMKQNVVVGTPEYMAPEVALDGEYSEKSDVYSFGIVLWEMMSRKKPFYHLGNKTPLAIMNLVNQGKRPPIEDVEDTMAIRDIITNCWDSKPVNRPSMSDVELKSFDLNLQSITSLINARSSD